MDKYVLCITPFAIAILVATCVILSGCEGSISGGQDSSDMRPQNDR